MKFETLDNLTCPCMYNRIYEEIRYTIRWLSRLGKLSMSTPVDALNEGDKCGQIDGCIVSLPGVPDPAYDYDGSYYHKQVRLPNDVRKRQRVLKHAGLIVLRVRVNAPPIPMDHAHLIVVRPQSLPRTTSFASWTG